MSYSTRGSGRCWGNRGTARGASSTSRSRDWSAASRRSTRWLRVVGSPSPCARRAAPGPTSIQPRATAAYAPRATTATNSRRWSVNRALGARRRRRPGRRGARRASPGTTRAIWERRNVRRVQPGPSSVSAAPPPRTSACLARPGPTRTRLVPPRVPRAARERTRSCHRRLRVSLALLRRTCRGFGREVSTIACRVPGARSGRTAARLRATRARLERTPTSRVARFAGRVPWVSTGRVPATRGASRARLVRTAKNSRRRRRRSALPAPRVTSATRWAPPRARRALQERTRPVTGPRSVSGVPRERTV
mmetsp:Transcript_8273/g.37684  ORF Transcript_8273/g.37684 Transcript_8273/m.37684 type:complete len:307 (-) Transcript_8273:7258-8178(-)